MVLTNDVPGGAPRRTIERRVFGERSLLANKYQIYGLRLASQFIFPELPALDNQSETDVIIRATDIPEELPGAKRHGGWVQATERICQLEIDGIARFQIADGQQVLVDRRAGTNSAVDDGDLRLFLLGSVLAVLLYQRGWLPLHASSVVTPAGMWAFTGDSGAGKSTTAAWLNASRGWPINSDDVAVVNPGDNEPILYPGPRKLKLWKEALHSLGIETGGLIRDYSRADKFHVPIKSDASVEPSKLKVLVQLCRSDGDDPPKVLEVRGAEAFRIVCSALYRPEFSSLFSVPAAQFFNIAKLANSVRVLKFYRPWQLAEMGSSMQPLIDEIFQCDSIERRASRSE